MLKYTFLLILFISSCEPSWDYALSGYDPDIVVEGWIENDNTARVILSQTIPLNTQLDTLALQNLPIRWAKVSISDGTQTEVLTGRIDTRYMQSYIYDGYKIVGKIGKTYSLKVEYAGRVLTAQTVIPKPAVLSKITINKCKNQDTLYQVNAYFYDDQREKNYYKFFSTVVNEDKRFFSSFMGTIDDGVAYKGVIKVPVYRDMKNYFKEKYTPYFSENEDIIIKFTQLPKEGFDFWSSYENEVTNNTNPLFPGNNNLTSNIQGGVGIWCGYGVTYYRFQVKDKIEIDY